jgi:hypothetical protein
MRDNLLDFFVLEEYALFPNKVYLSNDPSNPLRVKFIEDSMENVSISNDLIECRINYKNSSFNNSWFYAYIKLNRNLANANITKLIRSDGRILPVQNYWKFKLDNLYWIINIFDYLQSSDALKSIKYSIIFSEKTIEFNVTSPSITTITTEKYIETTKTTTTTPTTTTTTTTPEKPKLNFLKLLLDAIYSVAKKIWKAVVQWF